MSKTYLYQLQAIKSINDQEPCKAKLKIKGFLEKEDDMLDEFIDLSKSKLINNATEMLQIKDNVYAYFYKCNLTDIFVMQSKKIPVIYINILYSSNIVTNMLFTIYIYFKISNIDKFKSLQELLTKKLYGTYTMEIIIDEKINIIPLKHFHGYEEVILKLIKLLQREEILEIINFQIKTRTEERRDKFGSVSNFTPKKPLFNIDEMAERLKDGENIEDILNDIESDKKINV
jgi:hypothetical protein